jgi:3-dehydroquinate dehydratase-2
MKYSIWVIHGPNLNLLGTRETSVYGNTTLSTIDNGLTAWGSQHDTDIRCFQSNSEGALVDHIHQAQQENVQFIVINPGAYTHTSVAIRDALSGVQIPFIEVHLSNIHQRESFRHHSFLSDVATGTIVGLGPTGYRLALERAVELLADTPWPGVQ